MSNQAGMKVVPFGAEHAESVKELLVRYMEETYGVPWSGTLERLSEDQAEGRVSLAVALQGTCVGFVAWTPTYDLHHALPGAEVLDLFVARQARGWGVALRLIAFAAKEVRSAGGLFIRGTVSGQPANQRLYSRVAAVTEDVGCTVSGRAFQVLADAWQLDPRAAARALPSVSANYQS